MNELKPASDEKRTLSSDDDDEHFKDIHFPPDSALQQVRLEPIHPHHIKSPTFNNSFIFIIIPPFTLQGWAGTAKAKEVDPKNARN